MYKRIQQLKIIFLAREIEMCFAIRFGVFQHFLRVIMVFNQPLRYLFQTLSNICVLIIHNASILFMPLFYTAHENIQYILTNEMLQLKL